MKRIVTICLMSATVLMAGQAAYAQRPFPGGYDFNFIQESNPWLTSANASRLNELQVVRVSVVNAEVEKSNGGLVPSYGSDNSISSVFGTNSFVKVSDRLAFKGRLSYSVFNGKNMGGHYFMNPSYNPVNFVDNDPQRTGKKVQELFDVSGGISYKISSKFSLGGVFDYQSGYSAKRRDPRPYSNWMYMNIALGASFEISDAFIIGADLLYRRSHEATTVRIFGTTDITYYTLNDYGGYFGQVESLGTGSKMVGGTSGGTAVPMNNVFYGGGLQIHIGRKDAVNVFNELSFTARSGAYGERTTNVNSVEYYAFNGSAVSYNGVLSFPGISNLHQLSLYGEYSSLTNNENIYRTNSDAGTGSTVQYFGSNEVLRRTGVNGRLQYKGWSGISGFMPEWEYAVTADGNYHGQTAKIYPFYRKQNYFSYGIDAYCKKNFKYAENIFSVKGLAGFTGGGGTAKEDGVYASSTSKAPATNDTYLYRDFEAETASRARVGLSVRYTRRIGNIMSAYIEAEDVFNRALKSPEYLKDGNLNLFKITLGCTF